MQGRVLKDIRTKFDYSLGAHEILLSGSIGSAKSVLMAHVMLTHCLFNPGARFLAGRRALPDLKSTLFSKIIEHIGMDLIEGRDYSVHQASAFIRFRNGSQILSRSWADGRYMKVRSLELSGAAIEELTENEERTFYDEIKMRVGRLPNIKENIIISATNPGSPSHWAYKYFIDTHSLTRHVYYSVTTDNPFLPKQYIDQLKTDLDPKLARRMLHGEWIEIANEVIYYAYDKQHNFKDHEYAPNLGHPIWISWDFNIGEGKPLSLCLFQVIDDTYHVFGEVVVTGMRTQDSIDELCDRALLSYKTKYFITGDATGKSRNTRSVMSDYDIIRKGLSNRADFNFEMKNFSSNPPIRTRHNMVNAYCLNDRGERRLFVYKGAPTVDLGLRLTSLKKGATLIEDDSKPYQHITTALGYGLHAAKIYKIKDSQGTHRF